MDTCSVILSVHFLSYSQFTCKLFTRSIFTKSDYFAGGTQSLSASERLKRKKAGLANYGDKKENKEAVTKVTELANTILTRTGNMDIYQETREKILDKVAKFSLLRM